MTKLARILFINAFLAFNSVAQAAAIEAPQLPEWLAVEFEQKAFWAVARSRIEVLPTPDDPAIWELYVQSSVVNNSERVRVNFESATGRTLKRSRLSQGKQQRLKSYEYEADFIVRERREPLTNDGTVPQNWPATSHTELAYPASASEIMVTTPYMLLLLAQQLQAQGTGKSMDVLVHTDLNFYRVHLISGNGIPITANYDITGADRAIGTRETLAVAIHAEPDTILEKKNDFRLLGLNGEIILFFDRATGLPLQIRGQAPRIGSTEINLKSVTMRETKL
ncbi:MAG: hypothetical protein P8J79_07890 [Halioglobus sp.]|nr:hypothetical protein [Halioglobus sp.]